VRKRWRAFSEASSPDDAAVAEDAVAFSKAYLEADADADADAGADADADADADAGADADADADADAVADADAEADADTEEKDVKRGGNQSIKPYISMSRPAAVCLALQ
jgi:clumping factor B